jgi:hypothetical protein
VEQRNQPRGWHEYFVGFRINCESVPRLPAWAVRWALDDPRGISYLLIWRWMDSGEIKEALRISHCPPAVGGTELKRRDGTSQILSTIRRSLPRNGGSALLLVCPSCGVPRRYLYGWSVFSHRVMRSSWQCRTCAGLRYQSEGAITSYLGRLLGGYPRTPPWDPWAFSCPLRAREAVLA